MKQLDMRLETLTCPSCIAKIEGALKKLNGVDKDSIQVRFNASRVKLSFDDSLLAKEDIENAIAKLGFNVINSKVKE
ncbi:MAG: heavy-metal-associated domain-containing protein [Erysipelotrichaceae bacterium]|nr:heavy-metal-associated domain-containing protein [Erysipelotrichaceae bacterium]